MSIVDDYEFSVRAGNVLRRLGVETVDSLLTLDRADVLAQKNAGVRTWKEIAEAQARLRGPSPDDVRAARRAELLNLLSAVNNILDLEPDWRVEVHDGRVYVLEVLR